MIPGHSAGAATLHMNKDKLSQNSGNGNNGEERRRRVSVMNSTRNLMAYLKKDRSRSNMQTKAVTDPIDRFLRKVDTTKFMHKSADGFELDDEDGYVPQVLQCQLKGHTCIFLPSAPGRLVWDVLIAVMIIYYLFMVSVRPLCHVTHLIIASSNLTFIDSSLLPAMWHCYDFRLDECHAGQPRYLCELLLTFTTQKLMLSLGRDFG